MKILSRRVRGTHLLVSHPNLWYLQDLRKWVGVMEACHCYAWCQEGQVLCEQHLQRHFLTDWSTFNLYRWAEILKVQSELKQCVPCTGIARCCSASTTISFHLHYVCIYTTSASFLHFQTVLFSLSRSTSSVCSLIHDIQIIYDSIAFITNTRDQQTHEPHASHLLHSEIQFLTVCFWLPFQVHYQLSDFRNTTFYFRRVKCVNSSRWGILPICIEMFRWTSLQSVV